MSTDTEKGKTGDNFKYIREESTTYGALTKLIIGKILYGMNITSDITMETRMTKMETKFRVTQISVVDILDLLTLVRANNSPGNVTLVIAPPAGVLVSK